MLVDYVHHQKANYNWLTPELVPGEDHMNRKGKLDQQAMAAHTHSSSPMVWV